MLDRLRDAPGQSRARDRAEKDVVPRLLADLKAEPQGLRIDVVVGQPPAQGDHVSGFAHPGFRDVEVGEVWLPWTEDPDDADATRLRNGMGLAAESIGLARQGIAGDDPALAAADALVENNFALHNADAMTMLWGGFKGNPTHWYVVADPEPHTTPLLPGVKIHVLGPSRDEATIRDLEPPPDETFAHLLAPAAAPDTVVRPFDDGWSISADDFVSHSAFGDLHVSDATRARIHQLATDDLLAAAASLEGSVNGTSIVFVLEIGGLLLFFPGDAQWGTWKMVLDDPRARDLLRRSTFYKIGHHGSHNASPQTFVDTVMAPSTWAAMSVAGVKVWPSIPQPDLVDHIVGRDVHLVRSDAAPAAGAVPGVTVRDDVSIDLAFELPRS